MSPAQRLPDGTGIADSAGVSSEPGLAPGATLGVIGGGQLGRYFVLEARRLGYRTVVLDPDPGAPAMQLAEETLVGPYDDASALDRMASLCDAVTVEFENVPCDALESLAGRVRLAPLPSHVRVAQDRALEKRTAAGFGLRPVPWRSIDSLADVEALREGTLKPSVLKTARLGYDGKGQARCDDVDAVGRAFESFGAVPCVLEERVELLAELSVVLARDRQGASVAFPPSINVHRDGVLHTASVPSGLGSPLERRATEAARALADGLGYIGVLAVEFFVVDGGGDGTTLLFNEMAPRPHNSGHWTLDASSVSQFEQQLRALTGWPLARPHLLSPVSMVNLLGDAWNEGPPPFDRVAGIDGAALHLYGKASPRPGRKMGHVNCLADTATGAHERAAHAYDVAMSGQGQAT